MSSGGGGGGGGMVLVGGGTSGAFAFRRRDLLSTLRTCRDGLLVFPPAKRATQRVAVGDQSGRFSVFSVGKKLERVAAFETGAENAAAEGKPVCCACLFTDQLFFMRGSHLDAYSRKGKHFFSFNTNATEAIHTLRIETPFIFIAGDYMLTSFRETKELGFYMSPDRVNAMTVFCSNAAFSQASDKHFADYVCCLGCNDRVLRLVKENQLLEEVSAEAAVTAVAHDPRQRYVCYGTQSGTVGVLEITSSNALRRLGSYAPAQAGKGHGAAAVTAICFADVNGDGVSEIVIGCEDGGVAVLTALPDLRDKGRVTLERVWTAALPERVMSVAGGVVTQDAAHPDVLAHLYSGQVVAFTYTEADDGARRASLAQAPPTGPSQREVLAAQRAELERQLAELQQRIAAAGRELAATTGAVEKRAPVIAVASTFEASVSLRLVPGTATLALTIESSVPLEYAVLRSTADVRFLAAGASAVTHEDLDTGSGAGSGGGGAASAALSASSTRALAVVRPRDEAQRARGATRLEALLWATEGRADLLQATLYALPGPRTAQVKTVALRALPLYSRAAGFGEMLPASEAPYVLSRLTFRGSFSGRDAQEWLLQLLPDVPEVFQPGTPVMYFVSEFLHSVLAVEISEGGDGGAESTAVFTSDSLTALQAVRRCVSRAASAAGGAYTVQREEAVRYGSALRTLQALQPAMRACAAASQQALLLEGLRDLQGAEPDVGEFLPEHLAEVLRGADDVTARAAQQQENEQYLKRSVVSLYEALVDFKRHAPELTRALRLRLEEAAFGTGYSASTLAQLFFPGQEHTREREQLAAQLSGGTNIAAVVPHSGSIIGGAGDVGDANTAAAAAAAAAALGAGGGGGAEANDDLSVSGRSGDGGGADLSHELSTPSAASASDGGADAPPSRYANQQEL